MHISSLTDKFVSDPHTVVKAGDVVKVKVMEVDVERKRIGLSMRLDEKIEPVSHNQEPASRSPRAVSLVRANNVRPPSHSQ